MTISVRPVEKADLDALFELWPADDQRQFVAPNAVTVAEAAYEPAAYAFTIWAGDVRVGLIALIDMTELDPSEVAPEDEPEAGLLWRLMIGEAHQGNGYGTAAIQWAFEWARARGRPRMSVEVVETNTVAIALYERMGFRATGVMYGNEAQMARDL
ncbi:GNAT family N-acetyltransferase [Gymnodinialimonas hymeniacidonis]|uniref:GNAT family N-acetyltransferase n=1 Tax=Gymnodinialimonas hymeniacidonis TaxID=3126508 RepID=UPI0034C6A30E